MKRSSMFRMLIGLAAICMGSVRAQAAAKEFDFQDPKRVNAMAFVLDSLLEPIMGLASGISGKVSFDPENVEGLRGKITVPAKNLHIDNQGMKETLHGADWLDVEKYPDISFTFKKVSDVKPGPNKTFSMNITGDFTCKGVTKELTVPVKATYLPDKASSRTSRGSGDLLVLRSNFFIIRKDFNIKPEMGGDVVAEEIEIRVSIVGTEVKN